MFSVATRVNRSSAASLAPSNPAWASRLALMCFIVAVAEGSDIDEGYATSLCGLRGGKVTGSRLSESRRCSEIRVET